MSPDIDLTENRDFAPEFQSYDDMELADYDNDDMMTLDQYLKIERWERIFGSRKHRNRKGHLFGKPLKRRWYCLQCGKEVVCPPWSRLGKMLCKECSDTTGKTNMYTKFPWSLHKLNMVMTGDSGGRGRNDLFDLR